MNKIKLNFLCIEIWIEINGLGESVPTETLEGPVVSLYVATPLCVLTNNSLGVLRDHSAAEMQHADYRVDLLLSQYPKTTYIRPQVKWSPKEKAIRIDEEPHNPRKFFA